ncbi:golgin subfamily A member 6-like protein 7 [Eurosta solidaginis]|uniref:golgin subfamily A member 6-like protein 7 n=1 Tax=Eurosta solidaginis TaxID=178769 RepID=UPI0035308C56
MNCINSEDWEYNLDMAKLSELRIQQLKKELENRGLNTTGNKFELQARLREVMEWQGIDVDEYVFYPDGDETTTKIEEKNETSQTVTSTDMNMILAAISAQTSTVTSMSSQMSEMSTQITSKMETQLEEQKTYMASQLEVQEARISEMSSQMSSQLESQETRITSKIEVQLDEQKTHMTSQIAEQLKEQEARITLQLEAQEEGISTKLEAQETKVSSQLEAFSERKDKMEAEMDALKDRIQELQLNRPAVSTSNPKVKTPSFDGSVPFQVFNLQFGKTATVNNWNAGDKVAALFMALKGPAAEILQTIPEGELNCYEALMGALERRYGTEHRRQIYQMELLNRFQRHGETLQEFASDVERLAH